MGHIFCIILILREKLWQHHKMFHAISLIHKEIYEKLDASVCLRSYAIRWGDLYLLDIPQNFCTWVHLETSHSQKSHGFEGRGITHLVSHTIMLCECRCDPCFMCHFGRRIWWKHSFFRPTHLEVKVRSKSGQIRSNRQTQNFHSETCLYGPVLLQDSKNDFYFYVRRLEMPKNLFQKHQKCCHSLTPKPLSSTQILFHCEMYCWYVIEWYRDHWHSLSSFFRY